MVYQAQSDQHIFAQSFDSLHYYSHPSRHRLFASSLFISIITIFVCVLGIVIGIIQVEYMDEWLELDALSR